MNSDKKTKIIGTIVGIVFFIVAIAGLTYAWIIWNSDNTNVSGKVGCFPEVNYTTGTSLSTNNILLFDENIILKNDTILLKEGMAFLDVTASVNRGCNTPVKLVVSLDVKELSNGFINGSSVGAFKYVIARYDSSITDLSTLKGKTLDIVNKGSVNKLGEIEIDTAQIDNTTRGYLIIFYVDGDKAFNDVINANFSVDIIGKAVQMG